MVVHCVGIDFGDNERHVRVLAEGRAVIHDDTAALNRFVCKLQGLVTTSAENRDIESVEALWSRFFDGP